MKYFNFMVPKKILEYNNNVTMSCLKTATVYINTFSTSPTHKNRDNILDSKNEEFSWLSSARSNKKKADDLIPKIVAEIEAKPFFLKCVQEICDDLRYIFPAAEVTLFGSVRSNLALRNADVDIGINFKGIHRICHIRDELRRRKVFTSAKAILAKVPIIKCVHRNNVSCDISFSDHLGTLDNELMKFILSIDNRIRPLILILKFLLKKEGLLFNTHCLVVLTVFFLQTLENPLVPPISYLQGLATERKMFNGWDVSFTRDLSRLPPVSNQLSVTELLLKFFQFYAAFEFAFYVIAVFMGKFYLKPVFANADLLPEQFELYKRKVTENEVFKFNCSTYMCVQGFFNHSANISRNMIMKQVRNFQDYCRANAAIGQELLNENEGEEYKVEFLIKLFQGNKVTQEPEKTDSVSLHDVVFVQQNVCLHDTNSSENDFRNEWWKYIFVSVIEILRDAMKSEIRVKAKKIEGKCSDLVEENIISCEMQCAEYATKLRKEIGRNIDFPNDLTPVEKQIIITERLEKMLSGKVQNHSYKFDVICGFEKNPTRVRLKFEPKFENDKSDSELLNACLYLSKNIHKWIV